MKGLLYKEFRLNWPPAMFLFLLAGSLLLIPSWPYFIAFEYLFIAFNNIFIMGRGNQDILFTVSLPVRKKDIVLAKVASIVSVELVQILIAIPFAVLNNKLYPKGNMAGMNTNFAFFGFVLILYAVFNLIFLPGFYKTAYKVGVPLLLAVLASLIFAAAADVAVLAVPFLKTRLNGFGADHFASQLIVLIAGILVFAVLTWLAYRISADRFERVDL